MLNEKVKELIENLKLDKIESIQEKIEQISI